MIYTEQVLITIRTQERQKAFLVRGGRGKALCDYCKIQGNPQPRKATDYHEIVSRGRTINNPERRAMSFAVEICSCLCNHCHIDTNVHHPEAAQKLLQFNINLFGYDAVRFAFDMADSAGSHPLLIQFPEREVADEGHHN